MIVRLRLQQTRHVTGSIRRTVEKVNARREKQIAYNLEHGIIPRGVKRGDQASLHRYDDQVGKEALAISEGTGEEEVGQVLAELEEEMLEAARNLEFERAAILRDQIDALKDRKNSAYSAGRKKKHARTKAGRGNRK